MSRGLLARAWAAGAGLGDLPLTIDLDSTICETYGLLARLREGRPTPPGGAAHFLRETLGRVRYAGATGPLTVRPTAASTPTPSSPSAAGSGRFR